MEKKEKIYIIEEEKSNKKIGILFKGKMYLMTEGDTLESVYLQVKKEYPEVKEILLNQPEKIEYISLTEAQKKSETATKQKEQKYQTKTGKRIIAGVLALGTLVGVAMGLKGCSKTQENDISTESSKSLEDMSVEELFALLNVGKQLDAFNLINKTQSNFNNNVAPKIAKEEDKDARLYLTAEEMVALFTMANSDTYATETFYEIFGKSELLNASDISDNYTQAARILWMYYSRATEKSGMAELFQDESNKQLVEKFEELVIKYNTSNNEGKIETKEEINNFFNELTDISLSDPATKTNKEAVSYILTIGTSWAHANRIIDVETKDTLVEINEVVTCDDLYNELKYNQEYAFNQEKTENDNSEVVNQLPISMDKENIKTKNRDIEISINGIEEENYNYEITTTESKTTEKEETTTEKITKEEAEEKFGKEEVEKKEQEAEKEVEKENKQEEQDIKDYQNGYNAGYEAAYIYCATTGEKTSTQTSGSAKYKEGYEKGVNNGYKDGLIEYKAYLEAIKNSNTQEKPVTTPVAPEKDEEITISEKTSTQTTKQETTKNLQSSQMQSQPSLIIEEKPITTPVVPEEGEEIYIPENEEETLGTARVRS